MKEVNGRQLLKFSTSPFSIRITYVPLTMTFTNAYSSTTLIYNFISHSTFPTSTSTFPTSRLTTNLTIPIPIYLSMYHSSTSLAVHSTCLQYLPIYHSTCPTTTLSVDLPVYLSPRSIKPGEVSCSGVP